MKLKIFACAIASSVLATALPAQTNLFVAADGSAPFKTVQAAIMAVPSGSRVNPVVIHIAPGTYKELIYVQREKSFFRLVGENPTNTILTFNLYAGITNADGQPIGTFKTPSTTIRAPCDGICSISTASTPKTARRLRWSTLWPARAVWFIAGRA